MSNDARILKTQVWLEKCKSEHPNCTPRAYSLPKRLLSIGSSMGSRLHLVRTQDLDPENVQYAALSYCWGSAGVPGKTTKNNQTSYLKEIPTESLPATIHDALMISRSVNIRYLWVDALCIVQDDLDDWLAEVTNMSDIYYGSTLTIAASDATDSTGGFFARPSTANSDPNMVKRRDFFTIENLSSNFFVYIESRGDSPDGMISILHTRGWTLQELALSHRTIQFTQSELQWRCRCACWTESGMTYDASSMVYGNVPVASNDHLHDPVSKWWKWVESYSARSLTNLSDRMPAICGLVKHHQSITRDTNAAGLWRRSLHQDLLWMRTTSLSEKDLTVAYPGTIPSWSWLSCPVGVSYDFFGRHLENTEISDHVTIDDCELTWSEEPFASDIKLSLLTISGPARETFLEVAPNGRHFKPPYFLVDGDTPKSSEHAIPWSCAAQFDREQFRSPGNFLCLLVRRRLVVRTGYRTETFLILERAHEKFRRIGLGMFGGYIDKFSSNTTKTVNLI